MNTELLILSWNFKCEDGEVELIESLRQHPCVLVTLSAADNCLHVKTNVPAEAAIILLEAALQTAHDHADDSH